MIEINGIAHIALTVNRFEVCEKFYRQLLGFLGLTEVFGGECTLYFVGGKTAIAIGAASEAQRGEKFRQERIGLHHLCFRARTREDVDALHAFLQQMGAHIVHAPVEGPWAPGYYSLLFEDPDGIRLEINHVPGNGLLAPAATFNPAGDYK